MTLASVYGRALSGIHAPLITVDAHLFGVGFGKFSIVGLAEAAVKESKDRIRSALKNSRLQFPEENLTVNLAPADLRKNSCRFDLAIAISILIASDQIKPEHMEQYEFAGELALSGQLRSVGSILPAAIACARQKRTLIVPTVNAEEAALVPNLPLIACHHLLDVVTYLTDPKTESLYKKTSTPTIKVKHHTDMADIVGQHQAKFALEVAAAGGHHVLLCGPPGTGKSMLAKRLITLLPPLSEKQTIDTAAIHAIVNRGHLKTHWGQIPFRSPHHTASAAAIVGGGHPPQPGEISLAHHGVLFLDELTEFNRKTLESLREPLETQHIVIARAGHSETFPANFLLIAAMNPCPCGFYGSTDKVCRCTPDQVHRYLTKISGPLLDRFDIIIDVSPVPKKYFSLENNCEKSEAIRCRVEKARTIQLSRLNTLNNELTSPQIKRICSLPNELQHFFNQTCEKSSLSNRAYYKILKIARTIADLTEKTDIEKNDLIQAINLYARPHFL